MMESPGIKAVPLLTIDRMVLSVWAPKLAINKFGVSKSAEEKRKEDNLDKLNRYFCDLFENQKIEFEEGFPQGEKSVSYRYHYRFKCGVDLQFAPVFGINKRLYDSDFLKTEKEKERGYAVSVDDSEYGFRLEWNPNKNDIREMKKFLYPLRVSSLCRIETLNLFKINRIDVAIDYPVRLNPKFILADKLRKCFIAVGNDGVETVYHGARASHVFFRIYDKAKELLEKSGEDIGRDLWRVELEYKEHFKPLYGIPDGICKAFEKLRILKGITTDDLFLEMVLLSANQFGLKDILQRMPKRTRYRYKKKIESLREDIVHPSEVCRCDFKYVFEREMSKIKDAFGL